MPSGRTVGRIGVCHHDSVDATASVIHRNGYASKLLFGGVGCGNGEHCSDTGRHAAQVGLHSVHHNHVERQIDRHPVRHDPDVQAWPSCVFPRGGTGRPQGWSPLLTYGGDQTRHNAQ